jgi:membrane associated rhomboid family serine protease
MTGHHLWQSLADAARARVAIRLVGVIVLVHLAVALAGGPNSAAAVYEMLGLQRSTLMNGAIWQCWTYALLHGNWPHVAANAAAIFLLGGKTEHILGARGLLRVVVFGVLAGGLAHVLLTPASGDGQILVGISGAVLALLLFITTVSPGSRMWPIPVSGRSLGAGILIAEAVLVFIDPALGLPWFSAVGRWVVANIGPSWFDIAHGCHLGGGLAGWCYARWILRRRISLESLRRARERNGGRLN